MSRRFISIFLVVTALGWLAYARPGKDDPVFRQINSIVQSLSQITGLKEEHPVPYGRMTKKQLRHFLAKRIKKTLKPDEIYADELSLKLFGLVPQDFDLKKSTIDLLTEQAAAFYDYNDKKLFLLENSSVDAEVTTLAHELSHALADQHFNLEKFMEEAPVDDDENLAHTAVVEGEASWLMAAYTLKEDGQPPVPTPEMLKSIADSGDDSMAGYPILKESPLYIQQSLLFPYAQGILFFDAVHKKLGKASFAEVFTDPPSDTAQIIHPDRYFAHVKSVQPDLPKLQLDKLQDEITDGSVGEFDHQMLLWRYLGKSEADTLAPHLRGGQFEVLSVGKLKAPVLEYVSEWDSAETATAYFAAYRRILQSKWKHCDLSTLHPALLAGLGDNGYFITKLSGNSVTSIEGLPSRTQWERLKTPSSSPVALRVLFSHVSRPAAAFQP